MILQGYVVWGVEVVACLRGEFAFAIYDHRQPNADGVGRLLLARDHLGIKPLLYAVTDSGLVFGSEVRTIRASGMVSTEISQTALVAYLLTGSVPNPMSIYRHIQAIPPGSYIYLEGQTHNVKSVQYWQLPTDIIPAGNPADVVADVYAALQEAVQIRLISDVPLGAFLSGGLDSSAVVALMRGLTNGTLRTCSMVFDDPNYSEHQYSRAVAQALGTEHFERVITQQDVIQRLDHIFTSLDQPSIDGVNTYFVSLTAREAGLTVALSGLGGDELFGGYPNTFEGVPSVLRNLQRVQSIPVGASVVQVVLRHVLRERRWLKLADALIQSPSLANAYTVRRGLFSPSEVRQLVTPEVWQTAQFNAVAHVAQQQPYMNGYADADHTFSWISRAELLNYTHNQLLRDTDVMSMAHSLEVRVPLLDYRLVEKLLQLPATLKNMGDVPKPLFNSAMKDHLPPLVTDRRDKQGFVFPFATWLKEDLGQYVRTQLGDDVPYLQAGVLSQARADFSAGKLHWSRMWGLVALQGWLTSMS